jgi:hypothetical protein
LWSSHSTCKALPGGGWHWLNCSKRYSRLAMRKPTDHNAFEENVLTAEAAADLRWLVVPSGPAWRLKRLISVIRNDRGT